MSTNEFPTDPNAETIGLPTDESGKGTVPEPGKFVTQGMPSEIGRYRILGIIASGGMGVVYEAMQEAPRRRVALKIIKAGAASDMALHRFHFEAQTLAKLSHPNIAQIYEAGTWESENGEVPFFAMEYIAGAQSVTDYVKKREMSLRDRLGLFGKICDAVHHGHQKGVIHRDLKPDNILVDNNGEPKIIDFGVARATDADLAVTTMETTMGQLIGTLQYMSPEQCDADPDRIDIRSDVYALGVILFQLLSDHLPYDLRRLAIHEAVRIIKDERPLTMSTVNMSLKGDIETIVIKAMEKDRDRRYQSAAEFGQDVCHFLNNEPIIARPLSISYQLRLFTKKYRRTCVAVVVSALSIILGLIGTTWGMVEANHQRKIANEQRIIAEDRYVMALEMLRDNVGEIYGGIVKLDAATEVRRFVLETAKENMDRLEATEGPKDDILALQAFTHNLHGQYYWSIRAANLGDQAKALEHRNKALELYTELVNRGFAKHKLGVATTLYKISDFKKANEEYAKCLILLDKAEVSIGEFVLEFPEEIQGLRNKSSIAMARYDVLNKMGENEKAQKAIEMVLEDRRYRANASPRDLKLKRDYANALQRAGQTEFKLNNIEKSFEYHTVALDIFIELTEAEPENSRARRDMAWHYYFLGNTQMYLSQVDEAFVSLDKALFTFRDRCVAFPASANARNDIVMYLGEYMAFCEGNNQQERAKERTKSILLVLQPLVEANLYDGLAEMYKVVEDHYNSVATSVDAGNE